MTTSAANETWVTVGGVNVLLVSGDDSQPLIDMQPGGLTLEVGEDVAPRLRVSCFSAEGLIASSDDYDNIMRTWRVDSSLSTDEANSLLRKVAPLAARCAAGVIEPDEQDDCWHVYNDDALAAEREIAAAIADAEMDAWRARGQ